MNQTLLSTATVKLPPYLTRVLDGYDFHAIQSYYNSRRAALRTRSGPVRKCGHLEYNNGCPRCARAKRRIEKLEAAR